MQIAVADQQHEGYGILNMDGQFWSRRYFVSESEANDYIQMWWQNNPQFDLSRHSVVPVVMHMKINRKER